MSIHVISQVLRRKFGSPTRKIIAVKLADCADDHGRRVFPSVQTIANECEINTRTVQRTLHELVEDGLLTVVKEGGNGPGDTREYAFDMDAVSALPASKEEHSEPYKKGDTTPPLIAAKGGPESKKGDTDDNKGGAVPPNPSITRQLTVNDGFERFWKAYPKRYGDNPKKPARDKYERALRRGATPELLEAAAKDYAVKNPVPTQFIVQATRWFNEERWRDYRPPEPLPDTGRTYVRLLDPRWPALASRHRLEHGKDPPKDSLGGWYFPTEWVESERPQKNGKSTLLDDNRPHV